LKVFLDTNVLVSAFATRGLSADVLRAVLAEHELLCGEVVLEELRRVLLEKIGVPSARIDDIEALIRRYHIEAVPGRIYQLGLSDHSDEWVMASAIDAGADVFVTGDRELLEAAPAIPGIRILWPRAFWEELRRA
jgi:putative PIN family toxin of toxin-antitoxin system